MRVIAILPVFLSINLFAFSFGDITNVAKEALSTPQQTTTKSTKLSDTTVTNGLKEALSKGVEYAVSELGKDGGYLNNANVKIPLPANLQKAETLLRKFGGDKTADDLMLSMNKAATTAAPKTATIFADAIKNMSIEDAQKILSSSNKEAATDYFKAKTTTSLTSLITPIIQKSMEENSVAGYYNSFNSMYKTYAKGYVDNSQVASLAKGFGMGEYLPSGDENLDEYITQKAIDGLFSMIASKEAEIRANPLVRSTSLLKQVFGQ